MMAIRCKEYGLPYALGLKELESAKPKAKGVGLEVKAFGINFPNTLIIQ